MPSPCSISIAAQTSASLPGYSSTATTPTPAAAISGVQSSALLSFGSASCSNSSVIKGKSQVPLASRKGVAPRGFSLALPALPVSSCKFTSAPDSISFRTKFSEFMFPVIRGGGSPAGSSPRFARRTQVIACRGANPDRWSLGSAPQATSCRASSKWPLSMANINGLMPSRGCRPPVFFGFIVSLTSKPWPIKFRIAAVWPWRAANINGLKPDLREYSLFAPAVSI